MRSPSSETVISSSFNKPMAIYRSSLAKDERFKIWLFLRTVRVSKKSSLCLSMLLGITII